MAEVPCSVYLLRFPNGMNYIGITNNISRRFSSHKSPNYAKTSLITKAINQYGWDNIIKQVLANNLTRQQALTAEFKFSEIFNTIRNGFNLHVGPITAVNCTRLGQKNSLRSKQKLSVAMKGRKPSCKTINALKLKISKPVVDLINGYVFDSAIEASEAYLINKATLCDYLTGRRTNKTNLRYLEEV